MPSEAPVPGAGERRRARLRWQCRRGMLELDLLLGGFVEAHYDRLAPPERAALEALLELPDQLLHDYLLGGAVPIDPETAHVVRRIREAAGGTR